MADQPLPVPEALTDDGASLVSAGAGVGAPAVARGTRRAHGGAGAPAFEVMYLLDLPDNRIEDFRAAWGRLGDSIVVVGGEGLWTCHIHTDDVGGALEAALDAGGRPRRIQVTDLREEVSDVHAARDAELQRPAEPSGVLVTAVVAVAVGDGLARLLTERGVSRVVTGGQTMNPSTAELLAAADAAPAGEVVLLPNNPNIVGVTEQVDILSAKAVRTVPTVAVGQGLVALEAYDGAVDAATNAAAMAAVAERVRSGSVTQAVRASTCSAGPIEVGQWLGLVDGSGIVAVQADLGEAAQAVVERLLADASAGGPPPHRLLIFAGEGASLPVTRALRLWLDGHHSGLQVEEHDGGQPLYPYLFTAT